MLLFSLDTVVKNWFWILYVSLWGHTFLVADMNRRKERMISESKKIVENINAMTFANLDDQQVHSLMTMREIARGIANNRVEKVCKRGKVMILLYFSF